MNVVCYEQVCYERGLFQVVCYEQVSFEPTPFRSVLSCYKKHSISCLLHANACLPIVEQIHT